MKRWTALTAALALAASAGMALGQQDKDMGDSPQTKPAPKMEAKAATLKVGDPAPAMSIEKWVKGDAITGFEKGRVYVVEFWATWCGPCLRQMPHLTSLQREYKDKGLTVVGVTAMDKRNSLANVEDMVAAKGEKMGYTVAWDKDRATNKAYMEAANKNGIPCSFVVDQKGNVAFIGHPMQLDLVLPDVLASKWDYTTGPKGADDSWKKLNDDKMVVHRKAEEDPKAALGLMDSFDAKYPKFAFEPGERFKLQLEAGDAGASATANKLADQLVKEGDAQVLNEFAWELVDPEGDVKNPPLDAAMKAAQKAVDLTKEKDGAILDTLARVYWLKKDKARAIEIQRKAVEVADERIKEEVADRLKEYEADSKN